MVVVVMKRVGRCHLDSDGEERHADADRDRHARAHAHAHAHAPGGDGSGGGAGAVGPRGHGVTWDDPRGLADSRAQNGIDHEIDV